MAAYRLTLEQYEAYQQRILRWSSATAGSAIRKDADGLPPLTVVKPAVATHAKAESIKRKAITAATVDPTMLSAVALNAAAAGDPPPQKRDPPPRQPVAAAPSKYRNARCNGYASRKEAARAAALQLLQKAGEIFELREQVPFLITVNGMKICKYTCDFSYRDLGGQQITEDVKSTVTAKLPVFRLKKRLMKAVLGIEIKEVL